MNKITLDDSERTPCEVWSRVMGYHPIIEGRFIQGNKQYGS